MSWRNWINNGIGSQFSLRLAVGDETESWLNDWAEGSLRQEKSRGFILSIFMIAIRRQ